jgi:hypothetical protein
LDGVRLGSFPVADCAVAGVVLGGMLREAWVIVAWYVYFIIRDFVKPHVSEKGNKTLHEPKSI